MIKQLIIPINIEKILIQEQPSLCSFKNNQLYIGIPKESNSKEKRLSLTPETVSILTEQGVHVLVESGAGDGISYSDLDYSEAGAEVTADRERVWKSSVILKISIPTLEEIEMMQPRTILFSMMPFSLSSKSALLAMMKRHITAVSYHHMMDESGGRSLLEQQAEMEARAAIMLAANYLTEQGGGKGILLGGCAGVSPTQIVIIGADQAGFEAARAATALGAQVSVFDFRVEVLRSLQKELGQNIFTSTFHPKVFNRSIASADVILGCLPRNRQHSAFFVTDKMVGKMKKGAILMDLCCDRSNCVDPAICSVDGVDKIHDKNGIRVGFFPHISSRVARTASMSLSNHLYPLLIRMTESASYEQLVRDRVDMRTGIYLFHGKLVHPRVAEYFDMSWSDLSLFLTPMQ